MRDELTIFSVDLEMRDRFAMRAYSGTVFQTGQ